jgi:hypothetical protein
MPSNTTNQNISGSMGIPRDAKVYEAPSLTDTTLGLIGTSQKGPAFIPKTFQTFNSNDKPNGILNNFEDTFGRLKDLDEVNVSQLTAYEWFNQGGEQLTFVRTLGIGNTGIEDITTGITPGSGFFVGKEVVSGSVSENALDENSFSGGTNAYGKVNFICTSYENNNYQTDAGNKRFSSTNDYLEQIGISSDITNEFLINDVVFCPSGSQLLLASDLIDDSKLSRVRNEMTSQENSGTLSEKSKTKKPHIFIKGLKNVDRNLVINYNQQNVLVNEKKSYKSDYFNHNIKNYLHKGHLNYSSFYSSRNVTNIKAQTEIFHAVVTGSNELNTPVYENFESKYKTAKTPWIVSQPVNRNQIEDNRVDMHEKCLKLFRFHAYDDGEVGNGFRISIQPQRLGNNNTKEWSIFTLIVNKYDFKTNSFNPIFKLKDLNLNPESDSYIARVIGTKYFSYNTKTKKVEEHGLYSQKNNFLRVEIDDVIEFKEIEHYSLMPSGFMPYPIINASGLNNSISIGNASYSPKFNPVGCISNLLREDANSLIEEKYWGISFDNETQVTVDNVKINGSMFSIRLQKKLNSTSSEFRNFYPYTKYFQDSYLNTNLNVWKYELEEDNIDLTNSFFHLEKIMYPNYLDDDASLSEYWNYAMYRRDGKKISDIGSLGTADGSFKYINVDEILVSDTEGDSKHSDYLRFDMFTYGGFDGVNILDYDKKSLNQTAFVRELEDETSTSIYTGPTRFSYELGHNLVVDDANCEIDLLVFSEVGHNDFNKIVSIAAGENQKYLAITNASEFYNNSIVKNCNFYIEDPAAYEENPIDRQTILSDTLRDDISKGSSIALSSVEGKYFNNKFTLNVCNSVSCKLDVADIEDFDIVQGRFVAMPSFIAVKSIGGTLRKPLDSVTRQNSSIISTSFVFNSIFDNEQSNEYSQIVRNSQSSDINLNFIINNDVIKLNSANTSQINRNSLNRLAHNVRIMLDVKKKLNYDIIKSEIMFNHNSEVSQLGLLLRSIIDSRLNEYKVNNIIKDYFVSIENSSSRISRINALNNLLKTSVAISLFGRSDKGKIEEFTLADILNSTQNNLTEKANQNILTVKI